MQFFQRFELHRVCRVVVRIFPNLQRNLLPSNAVGRRIHYRKATLAKLFACHGVPASNNSMWSAVSSVPARCRRGFHLQSIEETEKRSEGSHGPTGNLPGGETVRGRCGNHTFSRLCTAGHQRADKIAHAHLGYSLIRFLWQMMRRAQSGQKDVAFSTPSPFQLATLSVRMQNRCVTAHLRRQKRGRLQM